MTDFNKLNQIAKDFWIKFQESEDIIYKNLLNRQEFNYNKSVSIITNIKLDLNIVNDIGTYLSIDTRNGMELEERKNYVEFILTPLFKKTNIPLLNAIYNEYLTCNLPKYWNVIKYKFFQPNFINSISITYQKKNLEKKESIDVDMIEINKEDFSYMSILNDEKTQINILLFINDDISQYLIKEEKYNDRKIWIPNDSGIHAILDSAIGEYNMLNKLDKIEIHLKSDLLTDEFKDIIVYKIDNLYNEFRLLNEHPLSNIIKCYNCNYTNSNVRLHKCKCKKVYYCDPICQKAHRKLHKNICI